MFLGVNDPFADNVRKTWAAIGGPFRLEAAAAKACAE